MLPFGPTTQAGACTLEEEHGKETAAARGLSDRAGRSATWKKKGKEDGKLGRIGGGFEGKGRASGREREGRKVRQGSWTVETEPAEREGF